MNYLDEFTGVMNNRIHSFDGRLGMNNYITNTTEKVALDTIEGLVVEIKADIQAGKGVVAKTKAVDIANLALILWKRL